MSGIDLGSSTPALTPPPAVIMQNCPGVSAAGVRVRLVHYIDRSDVRRSGRR